MVSTAGEQVNAFGDGITIQSYPVWAPDSSRFAFTGETDDLFGLYTGYPDSPELQQLVASDEAGLIAPSWSTDGSQIAIIQYVEDTARSQESASPCRSLTLTALA